MSDRKIYIVTGSLGTPTKKIYKAMVDKLNAQGIAVGGGQVGGIRPNGPQGAGISMLDHTESGVLTKLDRKISTVTGTNTFVFMGLGLGPHLDAIIRTYPEARVYLFKHANEELPAFRSGRLREICEKHSITLEDIDTYHQAHYAAVLRAQAMGMTSWRGINKPMLDKITLVPNTAYEGGVADTKLLISTLNVQ